MTHYNIFYNGCSFTCGGDIGGTGGIPDKNPGDAGYEYKLQNRFSQVVTNETGLTHCNISKGGVSNEHILESTVDWFEQGNTCDIAVIQWTQSFRFVYYTEDGTRMNINGKSPDILKRSNSFGRYSEQLTSYGMFHTHEQDQKRNDMYMYWMDYFLKGRCDVIYLKLCKELAEINPKYYETAMYPKYVNTHIDYIMGGILPKVGLVDKLFGDHPYYNAGHPNTAGHKKIADHLINIIKSRGY